ncbi:MAG: RNA polymerase sigma factor, partial [Acidimicrobiia bacterium]
VMTNLLIDHHRSAASERRAVDRLGQPETMDADTTSASALDRWNELVAVLPDSHRTIVTLYYADDLSVGQIPTLLGTSRGAVKAALFKARRTLRRHLDATDDGADTNGDTDG